MSVLKDIAGLIDAYCEKTGHLIMLTAIETDGEGETQCMTLHRSATPIIGLGMIKMLQDMLSTEVKSIKTIMKQAGERTVRTDEDSEEPPVKSEDRSEILRLLSEFQTLKEEGDRIKETDPSRLIDIMLELKAILTKLQSHKDVLVKVMTKNGVTNTKDMLDNFKDLF
jgi:hypothetical protein